YAQLVDVSYDRLGTGWGTPPANTEAEPFVLKQQPVGVAAEAENRLPSGRVLVVDDDPAWRESLQALLENDFEVVVATGPTEAMVALSRQPIQVVVTDFEMRGCNGLELLRKIAERAPMVVGILLTGHSEHPLVRTARQERQAFLVLPKTYRPSELLGKVKN